MDRLPIVSTETPDEVQKLYEETEAIPGRPGWRRDAQGKDWYSVAWIYTPAEFKEGQSKKC